MAENRMIERRHAAAGGNVCYWASAQPDPSRGWMVFLPGLSADHTLFDPQAAHFAGRWNLLSWDAPAHGLSRPWEGELSLDGMAEALHGILEAEGAERPVLVGQSLGGYVAQVFMGLHPGAARAFVSVDSLPLQRRYYRGWYLAVLRHMEGMCLMWGTEGFLKRQVAGNCCTTEHGRRDMERQLQHYSRRELCALLGRGYRAIAEAIAQNREREIDCPFMILCGSEDKAGFTKRIDEEWSRQTGVPVTWVEGAGHNSNADDPAFVNAAIDAFLEGLARNGA